MNALLRFDSEERFAAHCNLIDNALPLMANGECTAAVSLLDAALALGESPNARWNRALALLDVGRYREAWQDYEACWHLFKQWPRAEQLRRDLPLWRGEPLDGKRLVVSHEAGFGDTIMLLRYVPVLQKMGIDVALAMPPELERLASQLAPLVGELSERDVGISTYGLMPLLDCTTPETIPNGAYLRVDPTLQWARRLPNGRKIGIAWSSTRANNKPRNIGLDRFLELLDANGAALVSLQHHEQDDARWRGVITPEITDFADVAAIISLMDMIVCIDTSSLHLAGAIGHPNVYGVLPYVTCWRWRNGNPWHRGMITLCIQDLPGSWASAFHKIGVMNRG